MFVDLVTFKEVNDTLGVATGDRLLEEVRDRIEALLPERPSWPGSPATSSPCS